MSDFKFKFSLPKLVNAIAFFSESGVSDLTKLKIAKLLYFADKTHLLEFGAPILGDVYFCMDFGPVPSFALNEMNEAIFRSELSPRSPDRTVIDSVLRIRRPLWGYPLFEARTHYDASAFRESELDVLRRTAANYGRYSAGELVDLTHREPTWLITNDGRQSGSCALIPYELFFEGCDDRGQRHLAQLLARFPGEVIPMPGDAQYREFASSLFDDDLDVGDWSLDRDQMPKRALQNVG